MRLAQATLDRAHAVADVAWDASHALPLERVLTEVESLDGTESSGGFGHLIRGRPQGVLHGYEGTGVGRWSCRQQEHNGWFAAPAAEHR